MAKSIMDTHHIFNTLTASGFSETQANAIVESYTVSQDDLVTKDFLRAEINVSENRLLRWTVGSAVVITAAIIAGYFV